MPLGTHSARARAKKAPGCAESAVTMTHAQGVISCKAWQAVENSLSVAQTKTDCAYEKQRLTRSVAVEGIVHGPCEIGETGPRLGALAFWEGALGSTSTSGQRHTWLWALRRMSKYSECQPTE